MGARHLKLYAFAWLGFFGLLALLPVEYGKLEAFPASIHMLLWVAVSLLTAHGVHLAANHRNSHGAREFLSAGPPLRIPELHRLIWASLGLSLFGFVCLCYDRIIVQGIDFTQGVAVARHLWRQSGEEREGVSSIFSVLGYLFGFTFFVATTIGHLHWEFVARRTRWAIVGGAVVLVALNSLLTGGRSMVLVQLVSVAATCGMRSMLGLRMMPGRGARIWVGAAAVLTLAVGYSLYIFNERAEANGIEPERYVVGMLGFLGASPTPGFYELNSMPDTIAATAQFGTVAGAYLTHSFGTFESVLETQATPGTVSFGFARLLLAKLGLGEEDSADWWLTGRFLSVPGSLWYDFGWLGFYAGAVVLGVLLGLAPVFFRWRNGGGVSVVLVLTILITGLLSPLLLSIDILSVPFLILGFCILDAAARLWFGERSWILVSRKVRRADLRLGS